MLTAREGAPEGPPGSPQGLLPRAVSLWHARRVISVGPDEGAPLDEGTIRAFLAQEYPRIVGAVALVAGSRPAAEDAVQEALARAWERSERGETIGSLPAWVTRVAMNLSRSGLRRLRAELRARERLVAAPSEPGTAQADARVDLGRALAALPRRQREATVLRYHLGMDVAEIADALGVSEGTVKTSLHRARRALAAALGVEEDEEEDARVSPR